MSHQWQLTKSSPKVVSLVSPVSYQGSLGSLCGLPQGGPQNIPGMPLSSPSCA